MKGRKKERQRKDKTKLWNGMEWLWFWKPTNSESAKKFKISPLRRRHFAIPENDFRVEN